MRVTGIGHLLFALGLAGLGVLSLFSGDFAYVWQPVPMGVPAREILAHLSGALLLAGGLGLLVKRTAGPASFTMAAFLLGWVLMLQIPRVVHTPGNEGMWLGLAETTVLMTGGWTLFASLANPQARARMSFITSDRGTRLARIVFGFACLPPGLAVLFEGLPRLAATCEAAMISLFVILIHIPGAAAEPSSRFAWTMVFVASALAG